MNSNMYIKNCVEQFEALLKEQYRRAEAMKNAPAAMDYSTIDKIIIGYSITDEKEMKKTRYRYEF